MIHRADQIAWRVGALWLFVSLSLLRAGDPAYAPWYEKAFREAQAAYQGHPESAAAAWRFSRACFDRAECATNSAQRAEFGRLGVTAARNALALQTNSAAAYYYLGMNLGEVADATRTLGGLKLVSEMERSFKKAAEIDPAFDYAGPDRCLGLLYRDAPGWPISLGSRSKARVHLEQARQRAGDYPENQLNLIEAWIRWGEKEQALAELEAAEKVLTQARMKLTGEEWAMSWYDWDKAWKKIQRKTAGAKRPPPAPTDP
jgi:hypothetical protein